MTGLLLFALLTSYYKVYMTLEKLQDGKVSFPAKGISSFNECCFLKKSVHNSLFQNMYNNFIKQQCIGSSCF